MGRMSPLRQLLGSVPVRIGFALVATGLSAAAVARVALRTQSAPERCPEGLVSAGPRCCGGGQSFRDGACAGKATSCSALQALDDSGQCVARSEIVRIEGGVLALGATDWDGAPSANFPSTTV